MRVSHSITAAAVSVAAIVGFAGCASTPNAQPNRLPGSPVTTVGGTLAPLPTARRTTTSLLELSTTLPDPNAPSTTRARVVPTLPPPPASAPITEPSDNTLPPPFMVTDPPLAEPDAGAIAADFAAAYATIDSCAIEPTTCDVGRFAAPGTGAATYLTAKTDFWMERGLRAKPDSGPNHTEVTAIEVIDADTAYATACDVDGLVMVEVHDPTTADDDVVFDNSVTSTLVRWRMQRTNAGWRLVGGDQLARFPAAASCA